MLTKPFYTCPTLRLYIGDLVTSEEFDKRRIKGLAYLAAYDNDLSLAERTKAGCIAIRLSKR